MEAIEGTASVVAPSGFDGNGWPKHSKGALSSVPRYLFGQGDSNLRGTRSFCRSNHGCIGKTEDY